jgi:MFS family permease
MNLITKHWTVEHIPKSDRQERIESSLCLYIPGVPFNRWLLFISAFIIQFCCGSLYSWSVFNKPIDKLIYGSDTANQAVIAFYLAVASFGTTAMFLGPWLERNGPRNGLMLGSLAFGVGNAIAAISLQYHSIVGVYIGYGLFGGFGLGLNYISPVSALQKWFPDHRGLASGFAVGGFGAGSIVWAKVYIPLIAAVGLPATFGILGVSLTAVLLISAIPLRTPPNNFSSLEFGAVNTVFNNNNNNNNSDKAEKNAFEQSTSASDISHERTQYHDYTLIESIRSPDFFFLYLMFFCNQIFGLVALSRLSNMAQDLFGQTADEGSNVVAINGVFNCCGRLLFPLVSDLIIRLFSKGGNTFHPSAARKAIFFVTLATQIVVVSILPTLINTKNYGGFRAVMWLLTACYGAGFGSIPAFLTDMWGPYNIGALHGIMLTAWSIGGVAGGLGFNSNLILHKLDPFPIQYESNFTWILALLIVGFVLLFFVRTNPKDRQERGYRYSFFGFRIFHIGA